MEKNRKKHIYLFDNPSENEFKEIIKEIGNLQDYPSDCYNFNFHINCINLENISNELFIQLLNNIIRCQLCFDIKFSMINEGIVGNKLFIIYMMGDNRIVTEYCSFIINKDLFRGNSKGICDFYLCDVLGNVILNDNFPKLEKYINDELLSEDEKEEKQIIFFDSHTASDELSIAKRS